MVMNKRGQTAMVGLMIGIFIFLLAMVFIKPISSVITEQRGDTGLNCSEAGISDGHKMICLVLDLIMPYFIAVVIAVAGAWIGAKFV